MALFEEFVEEKHALVSDQMVWRCVSKAHLYSQVNSHTSKSDVKCLITFLGVQATGKYMTLCQEFLLKSEQLSEITYPDRITLEENL